MYTFKTHKHARRRHLYNFKKKLEHASFFPDIVLKKKRVQTISSSSLWIGGLFFLFNVELSGCHVRSSNTGFWFCSLYLFYETVLFRDCDWLPQDIYHMVLFSFVLLHSCPRTLSQLFLFLFPTGVCVLFDIIDCTFFITTFFLFVTLALF